MIVGIVTALVEEAKTLSPAPPALGACRPLGPGVWLARSGMGAERAERAGTQLLNHGATALLSWGIAAGLDPALSAGSLFLPTCVMGLDGVILTVDQDWRRRLCGQWAPGNAGVSPAFFIPPCPDGMLTECVPGNAGVSPALFIPLCPDGMLTECDAILTGPEDKKRLRQVAGAAAADMESAALARLAQRRGVPFCVVRAISDPADQVLPLCVTRSLNAAGQACLPALLARALARPGDWFALARLGRHYAAARKTLRQAAKSMMSDE